MQEYSIFRDTIADMTYPEVEEAVRGGAVALWALGVIEQHGPHLPLATDVYVPIARLRRARQVLAERRIPALIIPPFYWGVNHVTGLFPGTFHLRPEIMVEVMLDVFRSLVKDGFRRAFCLSGHGDALHNRTVDAGVVRGRAETGLDAYVILSEGLQTRLGLDPALPHLAVMPTERAAGPFLDVHAGDWETSVVSAEYPDLVREAIARTLPSTDFLPADLAEWRQGGEHAMRKTPRGYLGDPASADAERGARDLETESRWIADAIERAIQRAPR